MFVVVGKYTYIIIERLKYSRVKSTKLDTTIISGTIPLNILLFLLLLSLLVEGAYKKAGNETQKGKKEIKSKNKPKGHGVDKLNTISLLIIKHYNQIMPLANLHSIMSSSYLYTYIQDSNILQIYLDTNII